MSNAKREDLGKLILRVTVGGLMLFHGIAKLQSGVDGIGNMLEGKGLPASMAYGAYVGEFLAPLFMIAGVLVAPAALLIAFTMVIAIYTAHSADLLALGSSGQWAVETPMFFLLASVAVLLLGPGRYRVGKKSD